MRKSLVNHLKWWAGAKSAPSKSEWLQTYWPGEDFVASRVRAGITVFKTLKHPFFYKPDPLFGWGAKTESRVDTYTIPNSRHSLLLREPHVHELAAALSQKLSHVRSQQDPVLDNERKVKMLEAISAP